MATEEIEISELEFTEELASDNLIPVESSTDTKATSLQILKNWLSSFFINLIDNQTIDGTKTFLDAVNYQGINRGFALKNPNYDSLTVPTSIQGQYIAWTDKNGIDMSNINQIVRTDGSVSLSITARVKKTDGTGVDGVISIKALKDGTVQTSAPHPPASDYSTKIATTAWVRNEGGTVTAKSLNANGYVKFSSGLVLQWGANNSGKTVTFPSPFSMARPLVCITPIGKSKTQGIAISSITSTNFVAYTGDSWDYSWIAIGY